MLVNPREQAAGGGPARATGDHDLVLPLRADGSIVWRLANGEERRHVVDWTERLAVFVGRGESPEGRHLPVAGRYERRGEFLHFTPAFGFAVGQDYAVRTRRSGGPSVFTNLRLPREGPIPTAAVTDVYPSSDVLPENVLRFYVHFSVPMTPHMASDFVHLRDIAGVADRAAFMRFKQELWNEDRTRLTILIDPGRIKRGVATNLDLGPALVEGGHYLLAVDAGWPSADGSSVLPSFAKSFRVAEALRERPDVAQWTWRPPRAGTLDAFRIDFDRPFDRHLLSDALRVVGGDGQDIVGASQVGNHETSWSFIPDEPWADDTPRFVADDVLEDIAGNNLRELLDREISFDGEGGVGELQAGVSPASSRL